jgi:hypothetical protein
MGLHESKIGRQGTNREFWWRNILEYFLIQELGRRNRRRVLGECVVGTGCRCISFVIVPSVIHINGVEPSCSTTEVLVIYVSCQKDKAANREVLLKWSETYLPKICVSLRSYELEWNLIKEIYAKFFMVLKTICLIAIKFIITELH